MNHKNQLIFEKNLSCVSFFFLRFVQSKKYIIYLYFVFDIKHPTDNLTYVLILSLNTYFDTPKSNMFITSLK